ncbi:glycosyltransferase family 2 protein [Boseongicola sp. H5]|uniref:glycosyltransferase family 2 protein n=1 Tax=Boseongicola sp. H5 TaxID=2763261 RepID=UPI001D09BD26
MKHLKPHSTHGTVMAVSMMKDEAPFLLEWVAHHLAVGFTDILVYTNDCSDGTVEMLKRLEELGLGYHRPNTIPEGVKPQPSALKHAQNEPLVRQSDWLMVFDADEFLCINHPSGTLEGLLDNTVARDANGVVVTWRIFGSAGIVDWSRAPVTEQYTRAAPPLWNKGWGVKTLFRFDPQYWKLGIHRPSIKNKHLETGFPDTVRWLNGSGQPMEDYFRFRGWRSIRRTLGYDWAQMNHYAVKSVDSYAVRKFRGNVNNKKDKYNADYWALQDRNEVEDRAILRHAEKRAAIMAELLTDPVLNDLHETALARIEARLDDYRQTDAYAELKSSLIEAGKLPITRVEAKPPQARDPAKIAALMSRVEKTAADRPVTERRTDTVAGWAAEDGDPYVRGDIDLSGEVSVDWVANHGIALPADPRVFAPETLNAVLSGRFERRHARNIPGYLEGCARVLDIRTGVAFIPVRACLERPDLTVMAQDSRAPLIRIAREIAAKNGLADTSRLKLTDGPLRFASDGPGQASGLAACLRDFRPDCLRLSPPLQITPDMLATVEMGTVNRVLLPFVGEEDARALRERFTLALAAHGLSETPDRETSGSLQFDRA